MIWGCVKGLAGFGSMIEDSGVTVMVGVANQARPFNAQLFCSNVRGY